MNKKGVKLVQHALSHDTMYVRTSHFQIVLLLKTEHQKKSIYISTILSSKLMYIDLDFFGVHAFLLLRITNEFCSQHL